MPDFIECGVESDRDLVVVRLLGEASGFAKGMRRNERDRRTNVGGWACSLLH